MATAGNQPVIVTKPGVNVYTVMLILSFCALTVACTLLLLELGRYGAGVPWQTPGGS